MEAEEIVDSGILKTKNWMNSAGQAASVEGKDR